MNVSINIKASISGFGKFQVALVSGSYGFVGDLDEFLHNCLHQILGANMSNSAFRGHVCFTSSGSHVVAIVSPTGICLD
jgi:hypothetical protein